MTPSKGLEDGDGFDRVRSCFSSSLFEGSHINIVPSLSDVPGLRYVGIFVFCWIIFPSSLKVGGTFGQIGLPQVVTAALLRYIFVTEQALTLRGPWCIVALIAPVYSCTTGTWDPRAIDALLTLGIPTDFTEQ